MNTYETAFEVLPVNTMSTDAVIDVQETEQEEPKSFSEILTTFKVAQDVSEEVNLDNFNSLRVILDGMDYATAGQFCDTSELAWITSTYKADEIKVSKKGKVFKTGLLPNAYMSAKSVILNALKEGIAVYDADGNPLGKSALSKALVGNKKTPEEKVASILESLEKAIKNCSDIPAVLADVQSKVAAWTAPETEE